MGDITIFGARVIPYKNTLAWYTANNPVPSEGEWFIEIGGASIKAKLGDGVTPYLSLPYFGTGGGGGGGGDLQLTLNNGNVASNLAGGTSEILLVDSVTGRQLQLNETGVYLSGQFGLNYDSIAGEAGLTLKDKVNPFSAILVCNDGFTASRWFKFPENSKYSGSVTPNRLVVDEGYNPIAIYRLGAPTHSAEFDSEGFYIVSGSTFLGKLTLEAGLDQAILVLNSLGSSGPVKFAKIVAQTFYSADRTFVLPNSDGVISPATDVDLLGSYYGTGTLSAIGHGVYLNKSFGQLTFFNAGAFRGAFIPAVAGSFFQIQSSGSVFRVNIDTKAGFTANRFQLIPDDDGIFCIATDATTQGSLFGIGTVAAPVSGVLIDKINDDLKIYAGSVQVLRLSAVGAGGFITIKDATTGFSSSINVNPLTANRTHSLPNVNGELSVNSGGSSSQVLAGSTTMTVNHGYGYTPSRVFIQYISTRPAGANNEIVTNITGTTFDIVFPTPVTGTVGISHQGFK